MRSVAREIREITTDEIRTISTSFKGKLDAGELLTGTPTAVCSSSASLVLSNKQTNSESIEVNEDECLPGQAVQFKCDATGAAVGRWAVDIVCGTTEGQTLSGRVMVDVVAP